MIRTGVIVAAPPDTDPDWCREVRQRLEESFPGVVFAVVSGVRQSVSFEWEAEQ